MALNPDFNYDDLLSLDKAVLVSRNRINALGSQELVLDYNNITSATKEDCIEWLEANRLSLTDPYFSFKTYEGTYNCISITYNENIKKIRQQFKIDSQIGNLGEVTDPVTPPASQTGDLSKMSAGEELYRAYYWRIVNPTIIELPTSFIEGEIWTKTANDNGDGTYDVTVQKEVAQNLTSSSSVDASLYDETTVMNTNNDPQYFISDPLNTGTVPDANEGEIKRIDNVPLENGKYRTTITTRSSVSYRFPLTGSFQWFSDWDVSQPNHYILGKNRTIINFADDQALLPITTVRTHSLSINDDGTCNYTINGYV